MATKFRKSLSLITKLTSKHWRTLGDNASVRLRNFIRKSPQFFASVPYTQSYRERKVAGKAAAKGVSVSSRSAVPDLTLTGKFLNSIRRKNATKFDVTIGPGPQFKKIAEGNAANRRDITEDKLVEKVTKLMITDIEKILNRNIKRNKETVRLTINI